MSLVFTNDIHGWAELLPPRVPNPVCQGEWRVAKTVIGAGFTGLACARRLANLYPDDEIIMLDARSVGQAASGRNSGYAVSCSHFPGVFDPTQADHYARVNRINTAGLELLREQVDAYNIECQWHEQGFYHAAADDNSSQEAQNLAEYLDKMGVAHTVLSQSDMTKKLGTEWYRCGVHVHQGALVQPAALVYGLAETLPDNVHLYENSSVLNVDRETLTIKTAKATIRSDQVFIATNFEIARLGFLQRYIIGSTLSGSFTRRLTTAELALLGNQPQWGVLSLHGGGATVRLTEDGRISVRNTAEYHGGALLSNEELKKRQSIHRKAFENRFPQLRDVPFEYAWSGVEGITGNGTNFFSQAEPGIYIAGGYNGSGVSRGSAFGTALADYASGQDSELVGDCLNSPQAQWLPPRPLLDLGAWWTVRQRFRGVGRDR